MSFPFPGHLDGRRPVRPHRSLQRGPEPRRLTHRGRGEQNYGVFFKKSQNYIVAQLFGISSVVLFLSIFLKTKTVSPFVDCGAFADRLFLPRPQRINY